MVDSLDMTDADRRLVVESCRSAAEERIVITHGTDTMTQTAAKLEGLKDKVIVFTGSMQPARFRDSDAVFNLGCAVGALQALPPGIYIAMNGRLFAWDEVRKNRELGVFEGRSP